ncbi:MAG: S-methyl-5-thioribose-1-phosphate isomerase [Spirochaetales bacterium]|nr:S-methyl-5-thioribose-1-phosphate isomerase [Spirochaetales bacterium]
MTAPNYSSLAKTLVWENGALTLLDQTLLPLKVVSEKQESIEQVWDSIKCLKVRGAPAIGIAGAYGVLYGVKDKTDLSVKLFLEQLKMSAEYLDTARPTAVNLSWALNRMVLAAEKFADQFPDRSSSDIFDILKGEAVSIHEEDKKICRSIGLNGKGLIDEGMGILTHCNAGSLATSELGTATAPIYLAHEEGKKFRVFADETRPLLQGARLTSWELQQSGIDVTLITDSMAAFMMSKGEIDLVIVGTDRVAANGDTANKIGTMGVAILAQYFSIPFYVACPSSTIDFKTLSGEEIVIEERAPEEVTSFGERRTGPVGIKVRNPAFDVTPNSLITGFITDRGVVNAPFSENLKKAFE